MDSSRNDQNDDESSNRDNQNHNNYNYNGENNQQNHNSKSNSNGCITTETAKESATLIPTNVHCSHCNLHYDDDDDYDTLAVTTESANLTPTTMKHFLRKCSLTDNHYKYIVACRYHQD